MMVKKKGIRKERRGRGDIVRRMKGRERWKRKWKKRGGKKWWKRKM